jgi:hypothetical protein
MTAAKDQIIALLPKLDPQELAEVLAASKFVTTLSSAPKEPNLTSDWLINGIASHLIGKGLIAAQGALWGLKKRDAYKSYLSKLPAVAAFLARLERDQAKTLSRHRPQLAVVCAQALADWLERRGIFSVSAMLSQIDKLPEALSEAYPGYVEAGLFGFVLRMAEAR